MPLRPDDEVRQDGGGRVLCYCGPVVLKRSWGGLDFCGPQRRSRDAQSELHRLTDPAEGSATLGTAHPAAVLTWVGRHRGQRVG